MEDLVEFQKIRIEALQREVLRLKEYIQTFEENTEFFTNDVINLLKKHKNEQRPSV